MDDLISRDFIKSLGCECIAARDSKTHELLPISSIDALPPAQPTPHWIPCSERLPYAEYGESDNVLATCGHRNVEGGIIRWVRTLYFNGGNWCYPTGETYLEKVYAWMPLPEPYQVEGEQDG